MAQRCVHMPLVSIGIRSKSGWSMLLSLLRSSSLREQKSWGAFNPIDIWLELRNAAVRVSLLQEKIFPGERHLGILLYARSHVHEHLRCVCARARYLCAQGSCLAKGLMTCATVCCWQHCRTFLTDNKDFYFTKAFQDAYGAQARHNVRWHLSLLSPGFLARAFAVFCVLLLLTFTALVGFGMWVCFTHWRKCLHTLRNACSRVSLLTRCVWCFLCVGFDGC